ncbi:MAG: amidohydrolase family protein [Chloroflexi bacterium]|nr:amidohydrolase family protein [Chloroflexota bacterium]
MSAPPAVLIRDAKVIDGLGGEPLLAHDVLLAGGTIAAVGPTGTLAAPGAATFDAGGRALLPGLINLHVHLRRDDLRFDEPHPVQVLQALRNLIGCLRAGITTVRDVGCTERVSQVARDAVAAGLAPGPRVISSGQGITTTAGHGWSRWLRADDAGELRKRVRELVDAGADAIKVAASGGETETSNAFTAQYTTSELATLVDDAHRLGKRVAAHADATDSIRGAVDAGVDTIEHCGWMGADGTLEVDDRTVARMLAQGTTVVPTLAMWYRPAYDDLARLSPAQRRMRAVRDERALAWRAMWQAGVRFGAGTDTWDPLWRELGLMVERIGVSPLQAIAAATSAAAAGLGQGDRLGAIRPGYAADLVLVNGDPERDVTSLARVERVWKDGAVVVEGERVVVA